LLVDEPGAMRRLVRKLGTLKIEPVLAKETQPSPKAAREDLRQKILKRAHMIRSRLTSADKRGVAVHSAYPPQSGKPRSEQRHARAAAELRRASGVSQFGLSAWGATRWL
jgi:hypothetical protein